MAFRFRALAVGNPLPSYNVTDQKACAGGISFLVKCNTYWFAPVSALPFASPMLSG